MKILIINGSADLYGANRILLEVMLMLSPKRIVLVVPVNGPLVGLVNNSKDYEHVTVEIDPAVPVLARNMSSLKGMIGVGKKIRAFRRNLKRIIRQHNIQWAYINTLSCVLTLRVLKGLNIKRFLHVHEMLENNRLVTRTINKLALSWSNKIVTVSDPVRINLLFAQPSHVEKKVVTVLNGIPDKLQEGTKDYGKNGEVNITLFSRIIPEKGIWFFLDAIALLPQEIVKVCSFRIYGGAAPGKEHFLEKLKEDILQHKYGKQIAFTAFISDIGVALNESDIIVVPSLLRDSFPTTVLEGLSAGKPVIATNTGGAVQSVDDNITGFLINPSDTNRFAEKMNILIADEALRVQMGKAARSAFLKRFTLNSFRENLLKEIDAFETVIRK